MRAIRLSNVNLLFPLAPDEPGAGVRLTETGPDHPDFARWLAGAEDGEDPRPRQGASKPIRFDCPTGATAEEMTRIIAEVVARHRPPGSTTRRP
ncbi:MAG TPA: hypothetical protein VG013_08435 [Gemmataceae bacterium]|jgi:hypothetical protein|nr:hypothetical protein [Gemmataceae bacterium]